MQLLFQNNTGFIIFIVMGWLVGWVVVGEIFSQDPIHEGPILALLYPLYINTKRTEGKTRRAHLHMHKHLLNA